MRAARMHGYRQPLVLEDVKVPEIAANEVLLKVAAAGMCRTDAQMVDGYFEKYHPLTFPITPGHEIAGTVEKLGSLVPKTAALIEGDQVVVVGGMGDGTCRLCQAGNTQICGHGNGRDSVRPAVMGSSSRCLTNISSASTKNII